MRAAFFTSANSLQGGAEFSQVRIVRHLLGQGHAVHVVLPAESELTAHYRALGATVHVLYWQHLQRLSDPLHVLRYLLWLPVITIRLALLLRRERIDLLHVNEILDVQGLLAARLARVPSLVYVRIILPSRALRRALARIALALADRVVCVSRAVHRMALGSSRSDKVRVIYNGGPDPAAFDPARVRPIRPAGTDGALLVGLVAKLVRDKGHLLLLDLAGRLQAEGRDDVHYVLVGGEVPGHEAYADELRREIDRRGLAGRVHLVGKQRDIPAWMAGMDVVCHLPLCEDCFPAVPMEAAALGKPVLSFVSGGVPEQLTHPGSVRLVPIGDMEALLPHLRELLDDAHLRRRLGQAARAEVRAKFSLPRHFAELGAVYAELLPRPHRPASRRPRVMRVLYSLHVGGTERQALRVLESLRHAVDVELVTLADRGEVPFPAHWTNVPHHALGIDRPGPLPLRLARAAWRLRRLIVRRRPDVVHCSLVWPNLVGMLAGLLAGRRVWVTTHGQDVHLTPRRSLASLRGVARVLYRLCRPRLLAICESLATFTAELLGVPSRQVTVIPNGVPIPPCPRRPADGGPVRLVMLGRLVPVKNHAMALRTMAHLRQRGLDARLAIAGDGPLRASLEALAAELGVADRVAFLGQVEDAPALLADSDLLLQPSWNEGLPNAVLEAMAAGLAVVASDVGGIADVQRRTGTLTLVPPNDQPALDAAVARFAADRPGLEAAGAANRAAVARTMSLPVTVARWREQYELAARPAPFPLAFGRGRG